MADRDLTVFSMGILTVSGYSLTATAEREIKRDVTKDPCRVAFDFDTEMKATPYNLDKAERICCQMVTSSLSAPSASGLPG